MFKLRAIVNEIQGDGPKAIFMAGPAGAGKSFILKKLNIDGFKTINVDDDFEELLKQEFGDDIDFSKMSPEQLSQAAKFMGTARKTTKEKEIASVESLQNIVIDGTGAASNPLLKKKAELESLGYKTFMILIYVSPMTSLKRNADRGRSLPTSAVLSSWKD
jgi:dephospho-CoA kinase